MVYFDTNILIYNSIEQDLNKSVLSENLIKKAIKSGNFAISSLVLNDFIHFELADKYCEKIVTFDSDYKNLQELYSVKIEILGKKYE